MELKTTQINSANATISTTIKGDDIAKAEQNIAQSFAKKAKLDGFRAGKVPVAVVKKRYKNEIKQEAEQKLLQELLTEGLKKLEKGTDSVVGEPTFKKFDRKEDDIDIEVMISFKPKIKTDGYKECIPSHSTPRVTKKDIDSKKEELAKLVAPLKPIKEKRGIENGDFALFDFEGFVDGKAFEGGKAEAYTLEIGSGQFIPGFEDGMLGLKAGEEKDIEVKFPESYGSNDLAGKDAVFKVKILEIQSKQVPEKFDEEMLKQLLPQEENATEEKLEEQIKEQIKQEKLNKLYEEELKPKFAEAIVEKLEFDLPENIIEQELDMKLRQEWHTFSEEERESFKNDIEKLKAKKDEYKEDAENSVKLTFIVDELAKENNIEVSDQELMQTLYFQAYQQGQDPKAYVEMYEKQGLLPAIKMSMIEEKLFRELFFGKDDKKEKEAK